MQLDDEFRLYLDSNEYMKIMKNNFCYILRKSEYEIYNKGEYTFLFELWELSTYVLNIVADKFAVVEKNRWGKQNFWMLADNIKFGKIICKLNRR